MRAMSAVLALLLSVLILGSAACFDDKNPNPVNNFPDVMLPDVALGDVNVILSDGGLPDISIPEGGLDVTMLYSVGGSVAGLVGTGLVLEGDGTVDLPISPNGGAAVPFTFPVPVPGGTPYSVVVKTQPSNPTQVCTVAGGNGTVSGDVSNITVTCSTQKFAVGGTVSGLLGQGLVLQDNGTDSLPIAANGSFVFPTHVVSGSPYTVSVSANPTGPAQTCLVTMASGTVGNADVTDVQVNCSPDSFSIGGSVTGLMGSGLVLENNGGDDLAVSADGSFAFATKVPSGSSYKVTIKTQPSNPTQQCTVTGDQGMVAAGDVTAVTVNCATDKFTVGGTVSGLVGTGLTLTNEGGAPLAINSNGSFSFPPVASATPYSVAVGTQPGSPTQSCTVTNGTGTVGAANVTDVVVTCTTSSFKVRGQVTGLVGSGLVLQNDLGDDLSVTANGAFQFATPLPSGATYSVTVKTPPSNPQQQCNVTNAVGVVGSGDVTNIVVTCLSFVTIGGTATNVRLPGLVLVDNGTDLVAINGDGPYVFPTPLVQGSTYTVTIGSFPSQDPARQNCVVSNATGTVGSMPVTNVNVACDSYYIYVKVNFASAAYSGPFVAVSDGVDTETLNTATLDANGSIIVGLSTPYTTGSSYTVELTPEARSNTCFDRCEFILDGEPTGSNTLTQSMGTSNVLLTAECFCRGE